MVKFIDTHSHLFAEEFDEDRIAVVQRAIDKGIDKIFLPNIDIGTIEAMVEMTKQSPNHCFAMLGLHPCSVNENFINELKTMRTYFDKFDFKAVGEIGVDLFWDKSTYKIQLEAFDIQVNWAIEMDLPIIIHSRDSIEEILSHLEPYKGKVKGIFHCFSGDLEQAKRIIDLGFLMGIGGVLTFKNSGLQQVIVDIPLENLVLETDSPYLAPVPFRGKRNESSYLIEIAAFLAQTKGCSVDEVAETTTRNAMQIFKMS